MSVFVTLQSHSDEDARPLELTKAEAIEFQNFESHVQDSVRHARFGT